MIPVFQIFIDGKPYQGEDPDRLYTTGNPWSSNSFHTHRFVTNLLLIGEAGEPVKNIEGRLNLKSEIDKIIRRADDGLIQFEKMEIRMVSHETN